MKQLLLTLATLGLMACSSDSSGNGKDKRNNGGNQDLKPGTTAQDCNFGPNATTLEGRWTTVMASENFNINMNFDFATNGVVTLSNECITPTGSLTASVQAPYVDSGTAVDILAAAEREERNADMTCSASIAKSSMRYTFEGSCLVFQDNAGQKLYLTPIF